MLPSPRSRLATSVAEQILQLYAKGAVAELTHLFEKHADLLSSVLQGFALASVLHKYVECQNKIALREIASDSSKLVFVVYLLKTTEDQLAKWGAVVEYLSKDPAGHKSLGRHLELYFQQLAQTGLLHAMLNRRVGNIQASLNYLALNQRLATDLELHTTNVETKALLGLYYLVYGTVLRDVEEHLKAKSMFFCALRNLFHEFEMRFNQQTNVSLKGFKRSRKHKVKKLAVHCAIALINVGYLEEMQKNVLDSLQSFRLAEWIVRTFCAKSEGLAPVVTQLAQEAEQNYAWLKDETIKRNKNEKRDEIQFLKGLFNIEENRDQLLQAIEQFKREEDTAARQKTKLPFIEAICASSPRAPVRPAAKVDVELVKLAKHLIEHKQKPRVLVEDFEMMAHGGGGGVGGGEEENEEGPPR